MLTSGFKNINPSEENQWFKPIRVNRINSLTASYFESGDFQNEFIHPDSFASDNNSKNNQHSCYEKYC